MTIAGPVPALVDPVTGLTLRAPDVGDLDAIVETCTDPVTVEFTSVPRPYELSDAEAFLHLVTQPGAFPLWALEADRDGARRYCGSINVRPDADGWGEVGYAVHPAARGRGLATAALRLVRDYGLDVLGLSGLRWRGAVGNWASRRSAAAAGFRYDGRVRALIDRRGTRIDGWLATVTADDLRADLRWPLPPRLAGDQVVLREFDERDLDRIAEACRDPRTRHWLVSMPDPYGPEQALNYLEATREDAATGSAWSWCVADAQDDRCVGATSIDGFNGYHRRSEIGYWAHPDARGRGAITEAVRLATAYALGELGRDALLIRCAAENHASRHVAEVAGYGIVGTLRGAEPLGDGTLTDLVVYARP